MGRGWLVLMVAAWVVIAGYPAASVQAPSGQHPAEACSGDHHVAGAGWDLCWQREDVRVQGLEINRAFFENQSVAWKMGVPFSLTQYEHGTKFKDVLGTPTTPGTYGYGKGSLEINQSDCPRFHERGQLLDDGRVCVEHLDTIEPAVTLWSSYNAYNYRFVQGWTFHDRGVVEPFVMLGGHLFHGAWAGAGGDNHYHHVYWRLDLDVASPGNDTFQTFTHLPDAVDAPSPPTRTLQDVVEEARDVAASVEWTCDAASDSPTPVWCQADREVALRYEQRTHDKYRVVGENDTNAQDRRRSFEVLVRSEAPANRFSTFDVMNVQFEGDDEEIGHEVSASPPDDRDVRSYALPPENVSDPVVWVVYHGYHDPRDEDRRTMVPHYLSWEMRPRNLVDENPSHDTYPYP